MSGLWGRGAGTSCAPGHAARPSAHPPPGLRSEQTSRHPYRGSARSVPAHRDYLAMHRGARDRILTQDPGRVKDAGLGVPGPSASVPGQE